MTAVDERQLVVTEPGVYDLPDEVYHSDPVPGGSLSSSGAKLLLPPNAPALFKWRRENPEPPRRVYDLGKAAHQVVLGTGPELVVVHAADWRTKAAQQDRAAAHAAGKVPVLAHEHRDVLGMAAAIREHQFASKLFDPATGRPERSLFWHDDEFGVWRRARLDWLPDRISSRGRLIVPDYKTCEKADIESVRKAVHRFGYHLQADWYGTAARAVGLAADVLFVLVFQERTAPYLIHVVAPDTIALRTARDLNRSALATYAECTATGVWPGYSDDEIGFVDLPPWAQTSKENNW